MWTGIIFIAVAVACLLAVTLMSGTLRRPRLRSGGKPPQAPIVGWGNDTKLPRL